jgi:hypothetical protein
MATNNSSNQPTTTNTLLYGNGTGFSVISAANNSTLITSAGGVPSLSTTLPTAVQSNITQLNGLVATIATGSGTAIFNKLVQAGTVAGSDAYFSTYVQPTGTPSYAYLQASLTPGASYQWGISNATSNLSMWVNGAGATTIWNSTTAGIITMPLQPQFSFYLASNAINVTGDATSYALGTDVLTLDYQRGSGMAANGTFTAPVAGIYVFILTVTLTGIGTQTSMNLSVTTSGGTYNGPFSNPTNAKNGSGNAAIQMTCQAQMAAGDTATFNVAVSGGSKTVSVAGQGSPSGFETYVQGYLLA